MNVELRLAGGTIASLHGTVSEIAQLLGTINTGETTQGRNFRLGVGG